MWATIGPIQAPPRDERVLVTVSRPVGGILSTLRRGLGGHPSERSTWGWCIRRCTGRAARTPCSTLLRVGFTEPPGSPRTLVRSYRTVSPLPVRDLEASPSAVCSLWHFPAGRPDWPLASTLPCGVPTFLDPPRTESPPPVGPRPPGRLTVPPMVPQMSTSNGHEAPIPTPAPSLGLVGRCVAWIVLLRHVTSGL